MTLTPLMDKTFSTTAGSKRLSEILDPDRPTVFMAYPMDFTPVCTAQMCSYRDNWSAMSALPVRWWGINQAPPEKHERFKAEKKLPFDLITDSTGDLLKALGLWGILKTRRGFAVVAPNGEVLGATSIFPFFYQKTDSVLGFVGPLLAKLSSFDQAKIVH